MTTNFFQSIADMQVQGGWNIIIARGEADTLIVSVLLTNDKAGDDASKLIPPMLLKGTPQELDEGFFAAIASPVKETSGLFANMEQYAKQLAEAKKQSKMEQDKGTKENKEKEERRKKYEVIMKKVEELEEAKKIQEAIANLPKEKDFPEQVEEIREKLEVLRKQNAQLTLI